MITEKCNMMCEHCCYSCTSEGRDMSRRVFRQACELAEERGDTISIGGGEPTTHPLFWDFIGIALAATSQDEGMLWLATNGKRTEDAIRLADLARRGVLAVDLSQDWYHEEIDERVVQAFTRGREKQGSNYYDGRQNSDMRSVRDVSGKVCSIGRAEGWGDTTSCPCPDLFVHPTGKLYLCGCLKETAGTVWKPKVPEDYEGECPRERHEREARCTGQEAGAL